MGSFLADAIRQLGQPIVAAADGSANWCGCTRQPGQSQSGVCLVDSVCPLEYTATAIAALQTGRDVMLCNPGWTKTERLAAESLAENPPSPRLGAAPRLLVATGGSGGVLRFAVHTPATLTAAAMSLQRFAGGGLINSLCLLPLYHISGFQQLVRALATGGRLMIDEWASVAAGRLPSLPECNDGWTVSLVPTQLHRLIASPAAVEWLRGFRLILLGGAPAGAELLATARRAGLALAQSYGSSETAAAVAAVTPTCFLAGNNGYEALGHASIRIVDTESGMESPPGHIGQVIVESSSLFLGYWPEPRPPGPWAAGDLGLIDAYGRLQLVGRCDAAINTGGEKVHPAEVEAALLSTGAFSEVFVSGAPDPRWGECVVACFPAADQPSLDKVELQLRTQLSPHKLPRRWLPVQDWPLTSQGKTDRNRLRSLVSSAKNST